MSAEELIRSLNHEARERQQAIRDEARAETEKLRAEAKRKVEALSLKYRAEEAEALREKAAEITAVAEVQARAIRQETSEELGERFLALAFSSLAELRADGYQRVFRALAAEIPPYEWKVVRVNPADEDLASEVFPGAEVVCDDSISGGLETSSEDGRVRVINTFEKRLERAWDEVLPRLIKEAYGK
jgi:vacuolar-type H+-ATPase subunit E/Vma4